MIASTFSLSLVLPYLCSHTTASSRLIGKHDSYDGHNTKEGRTEVDGDGARCTGERRHNDGCNAHQSVECYRCAVARGTMSRWKYFRRYGVQCAVILRVRSDQVPKVSEILLTYDVDGNADCA